MKKTKVIFKKLPLSMLQTIESIDIVPIKKLAIFDLFFVLKENNKRLRKSKVGKSL